MSNFAVLSKFDLLFYILAFILLYSISSDILTTGNSVKGTVLKCS